MENIFSNYDHAIEREQDKVFWPISLSNLNTANQITSFNIKKESNFLNIKKAKYQIFGRVLQSDSSDYPEKSIILLIDNFVGWLFKWIEVKIHGKVIDRIDNVGRCSLIKGTISYSTRP